MSRGIDTPSTTTGPPEPEPSNPFHAPPPGYPPAAAPGYDVPPGGPPPGWAPPPPPQTTSGLAITSLVLSLVGLGLFGLIFGIVALGRIRRSGQKGKGLAWAGIVLSVLGLVATVALGGLVYSAFQDSRTERNTAGEVTAPADARTADLRTGDCVTGLSEAKDATPKVVPCSEKYEAEVFATFELPAGKYPGDAKVQELADAGCSSRFDETGATAEDDADIWYLYPSSELGWIADRAVVCLTSPSGP